MQHSGRIVHAAVILLAVTWVGWSSAGDLCTPVHLTATPPSFFGNFGISTDYDGQRIIIGSPNETPLTGGTGAGIVFRNDHGVWVQEQALCGFDATSGFEIGYDVAIDGDVAMASTIFHTHPGQIGNGAVYAFRLKGDRWVDEQEILPARGTFGHLFGWSIDVSGDVAIIGTPGDSECGQSVGAVYVFRHNGSTWIQEQKLHASDAQPGDSLGYAVALCGDVALIGAPGDDARLQFQVGAAYVFRYDPRARRWFEEQKLTAINVTPPDGDLFGTSVALSCSGSDDGLAAIIGAYADDQPGGVNTGSAYVFRYDPRAANWYQEQELVPEPDASAQFGRSVAIDGDWAVVGVYKSDLAGPQHGAAMAYAYDGNQWSLEQTLLPNPSTTTLPLFGWSVSLRGNTALVSAHGEMGQSGSVYVYNVDPIFADLNCDNHVNGLDLAILLSSWGPLPKRGNLDPAADLDSSGIVNGFDLALLLGAWG